MAEAIIDRIIERKRAIEEKTKQLITKPLVLFVSQEEDETIFNVLKENKIDIDYVCNLNRNLSFQIAGYNLSEFQDIISKNGTDINIFISTAKNKVVDAIIEYVKKFNVCENNIYFGPTRNSYTDLYERRQEIFDNGDKIQKVYEALSDNKSKSVYEKIFTRLISKYVFHYEYEDEDFKQYFSPIFFQCSEHEIFLDAGTRDGKTSREFIEFVKGKYEYIYGFEADKNNYEEIIQNTQDIAKASYYNKALYNKEIKLGFASSNMSKTPGSAHISTSGDVYVQAVSGDYLNIKATFIKMDIEGAEIPALDGLKNTISSCKPKMAVCIYHSLSDFWEVPLKILELNPSYRIAIRNHVNMNCLIESVCYAY